MAAGSLLWLAVAAALATALAADSGEVRRQWGVPDTSIVVGRLFNFSIPADAFQGHVSKFQVVEAGEDRLPSWLSLVEEKGSSPLVRLVGVPLQGDVGPHYLAVKAIGGTHGESQAQDVFSVEVLDEERIATRGPCGSGDPIAVAVLTVDADANRESPEARAQLLYGLAKFLGFSTKEITLSPMAPGEPAYDEAALLAGAGNSRQRHTQGLRLRWRVGCSSDVEAAHAAALARLETAARDSTLAKLLGHSIVGWHVSNVQARQTRAHANHVAGTPLLPAVLPTIVISSSSSMEASEQPIATPETRIVPTMASPMMGGHSSHAHRHHHGDHVRHGVIAPSPTLTMVTLPTALPSGHTPPLPPIRPTRTVTGWEASGVLEATPTFGPGIVEPTSRPPEPSLSPPLQPTVTRKPGNSRPMLNKRLQKLIVTAGKVWSYQIPKDVFLDAEDGDTRNLKLMFVTSAGTAIEPRSWIQFDPEKQTLSALPLDDNIGKYTFILEAMDAEGDTVQDMVEINVWQHTGARAVHHKFNTTLKPKRWEYVNSLDWQIAVVRRLAKFFGDPDESQITVLAAMSDPFTLSWTNDSLPKHPCPREQLDTLYDRMVDKAGGPSPAFKKALGNLKLLSVRVEYSGVCQPPASSAPPLENQAPTRRNPIGQINATVGEILRFIIPDDTFYDYEDGSTRYLALSFLSADGVQLPQTSWIQFNPRTQELYGLPLDVDIPRHEFQMVAQDSAGATVTDVFVVLVQPRAQMKWAVEFSLHLKEDFEAFSRNISRKVLVAWKLAQLYGDPDPRFITVNTISQGSVVYAWTNNTLRYEPCPTETILQLMRRLVHDNQTLTQRLIDEMRPEFHVLKADTMPLGLCMDKGLPPTIVAGAGTAAAPTAPPPGETIPPADDDDVYITTIIPAAVIAAMLLLAALIACLLYRKKRKGKLSMQDSSTFINKGIPIIFADELEDKPDPAKPPVIMKEERPPLPPPEYPRGATPQTGRRTITPRGADIADSAAPYQHPTPPFASGHADRRPKAAPTYRQPPPYVPP